MQITDNALPTIEYKKIANYLMSEDPNWSFVKNVTFGSHRNSGSWGFAFSVFDSGAVPGRNDTELMQHRFAYNILKPLIIDESKLLRVRVGMIVNVGPEDAHDPHIDQTDMPHWTQLYYVTGGDAHTNVFKEYGYTEEYKKYKPEDFTLEFQCKPEPNRMFMFDGYHWHSSSHVFGSELRIVVANNYAK